MIIRESVFILIVAYFAIISIVNLLIEVVELSIHLNYLPTKGFAFCKLKHLVCIGLLLNCHIFIKNTGIGRRTSIIPTVTTAV